jgi:hypothetical protein
MNPVLDYVTPDLSTKMLVREMNFDRKEFKKQWNKRRRNAELSRTQLGAVYHSIMALGNNTVHTTSDN